MGGVELKITYSWNLKDIINAYSEMRDEIRAGVTEVWDDAGDLLFNACEQMCPSPFSSYYPTNSTGNLAQSHILSPTNSDGDTIRVGVSNECEYSGYVHAGHGTVPARPWMRYALLSVLDTVQEMLMDKIHDVIQTAISGVT